MWPFELRMFILCLVVQVTCGISICQFSDELEKIINETAGPKDGPLYTILGRNTDVSFNAYASFRGSHLPLNSYFNLTKVPLKNGTELFQLSLSKVINMDWASEVSRQGNGGLLIWIEFLCVNKSTTHDVGGSYFNLIVLPVDNYPPEIDPDSIVFVREDVAVGYAFSDLRNAVKDRDHPNYNTLIAFTIIRNPNNQLDGSDVFSTTSNGALSAIRPLDYESGVVVYQLNISVWNSINQTAKGIVTVKVLNVNDNPVRFLYKGCKSQCFYELSSYGKENPKIGAIDEDDEPIHYSITNVSPGTEVDIIIINPTTGILRQIQHRHDPALRLLIMTIKAKTNSSLMIGRGRNPLSLNEDYATVKIRFAPQYYSVSGSDRLCHNEFVLPGLLMIYRLVKLGV